MLYPQVLSPLSDADCDLLGEECSLLVGARRCQFFLGEWGDNLTVASADMAATAGWGMTFSLFVIPYALFL